MSKGSTRRPTFITPEEEEAAWERTFGRRTNEERDCPVCGGRAFLARDGWRCAEHGLLNGAGGI